MARNELFEKADSLGVKYKKNEKTEIIEARIAEAEDAKNIEEKASGYLDPEPKDDVENNDEPKLEKTEPAKKEASVPPRLAANRMVRCIINPLSDSMKGINSEMYSVGTGKTGFVKKVVRFNEETLEPLIIVKHLKGKKMLIQSDGKSEGSVKLKNLPAFNITVLPDYTEKELEELFAKGRASK